MNANIEISKDSIERIQSALMSKLEQYAATIPSPTCLDYADGELSVTKDKGRKKVKGTKKYHDQPTRSMKHYLHAAGRNISKKHVHPLSNTQ